MKTKFTIISIAFIFTMQITQAQEAMRLHLSASKVENFLLNDIRKLTFSSGNINVNMFDGKTNDFSLSEILKISFGEKIITGIANFPATGFDVLAYVSSSGEIVVESSAAIKSLALVSIDGRIINLENYYVAVDVKTARLKQPQSTGIYMLRIETQQGIIIKKIINSKNHF